MARIGKIARLPKNIREELNQRLADNERAAVTLGWLNESPDVQKILAREFEGRAVNKQNLSDWRRGGFVEWEMREDFWRHAPKRKQAANLITEESNDLDSQFVDSLADVAAGRLAELLARWDGEVTAEMERKLKWLRVVSQEAVRLQRGQVDTALKRITLARREQEEADAQAEREQEEIDEEEFTEKYGGVITQIQEAERAVKAGQDEEEETEETQGDEEEEPAGEEEAASDEAAVEQPPMTPDGAGESQAAGETRETSEEGGEKTESPG